MRLAHHTVVCFHASPSVVHRVQCVVRCGAWCGACGRWMGVLMYQPQWPRWQGMVCFTASHFNHTHLCACRPCSVSFSAPPTHDRFRACSLSLSHTHTHTHTLCVCLAESAWCDTCGWCVTVPSAPTAFFKSRLQPTLNPPVSGLKSL